MRNHTVEISDKSGHMFKLVISTVQLFGQVKDLLAGDNQTVDVSMTGGPTGNAIVFKHQVPGYWRAIDQGFIRYGSGKVFIDLNGADATTRDIYLVNMDGTWGMKLFEYEDAMGVNDQASGFVIQPWVLRASPGKFSWVSID